MSSIAIVVLDTLRKDFFDEYFDWLPGLRFESAYSTSNWTGPAHASLFTGHYGSTVGVTSKSPSLSCDRQVLPEILAERGFTTRGWSANTNASTATDFDRGFEEFLGPTELQSGNRDLLNFTKFAADNQNLSRKQRYIRAVYESIVGEYETLASLWYGFNHVRGKDVKLIPDDGASVVQQRAADLNVNKNEFLFINLVEAHTPYFPPADYRDFDEAVRMAFGDAYVGVDDPDLTRRAYRSSVRYLSDVYEEIFEALIDKFDFVVTLSDHGELLGEHHDLWNHVAGIYPELTHIPLVLSGVGETGETDKLVSIIDVYSTVLDLLDVNGPTSRGRVITQSQEVTSSCLAEYRGPFQRSIRRSKKHDFDLEKYDHDLFALIEPGYYGYEDFDGWKEYGVQQRDEPREFMYDRLSEYDMESITAEAVELSDEAERRLEKLGYI